MAGIGISQDNLVDNQDYKNGSVVDIPNEDAIPPKPTKFGLIRKHGPFAVFLALLLGYFIWATVYFIDHNYSSELGDVFDQTTCTGYGFLTIVYVFITYGVLYKLIIRPIIKPTLKRYVWTPITTQLRKIRYLTYIVYGIISLFSLAFLIYDAWDDKGRLMPLSGIAIFLIGGWIFSTSRKDIAWKTVISGLILQFLFGVLTIRWEIGRNVFSCIGDKVTAFLNYALEGAKFVYGDYLITTLGVFAFASLATIFLLGFLVNVLYYYGIMQSIVLGIGRFLGSIMGTSITESLNSAANIFLGQTEAPLLLKPYLKDLTASEIHSVMASGFATVAGTVLAAYISFGANAAHLITASVMSAPSALCYSKLVCPETEESKSTKKYIKYTQCEYESPMDAGSKGAMDAMNLVMGIIANLMAIISVLALINGILTFMGERVGFYDDQAWTVQLIAGKVFIPLSFVIGVPWNETEMVGRLIGVKTMVNEFVAFQEMQNMTLTPRTKVLATYAICGFSNPGSIAMMISALTGLMPNKKPQVLQHVFRAFMTGAIVCLMTACFAGLLIPDEANV